jgi:hypothetical protein
MLQVPVDNTVDVTGSCWQYCGCYRFLLTILWMLQVPVDNTVDASSVKAYGPGLDPKKCRVGTPLAFKVDATKSGKAPLGVNIQTDRGMWSLCKCAPV